MIKQVAKLIDLTICVLQQKKKPVIARDYSFNPRMHTVYIVWPLGGRRVPSFSAKCASPIQGGWSLTVNSAE